MARARAPRDPHPRASATAADDSSLVTAVSRILGLPERRSRGVELGVAEGHREQREMRGILRAVEDEEGIVSE